MKISTLQFVQWQCWQFKVKGPDGVQSLKAIITDSPLSEEYGFVVTAANDGTIFGSIPIGATTDNLIPAQSSPMQLLTLKAFVQKGQIPCISDSMFLDGNHQPKDSRWEKRLNHGVGCLKGKISWHQRPISVTGFCKRAEIFKDFPPLCFALRTVCLLRSLPVSLGPLHHFLS